MDNYSKTWIKTRKENPTGFEILEYLRGRKIDTLPEQLEQAWKLFIKHGEILK